MSTRPHLVTRGSGQHSAPVSMVAAGAAAAASGPVIGSVCAGYGGIDLGVRALDHGRFAATVSRPQPIRSR